MQLVPYLNFDGTCKAAFEFYAKVLRGRIAFMQTFGESPMASQMPPDAANRVMHVRVEAESALLMGSDAPPGQGKKTQGFAVALVLKEPAEAERIFEALSERGKVDMPMQQTYFADRFGMCVDKFGTPWIVNGNLHD
ncbi:MAG TPA: VOC family protein [Gemmatimonadaceae bacterium]|jgi:PhnB protein|nr:VOC family protein [Gemmatimonadaceae bacterium]